MSWIASAVHTFSFVQGAAVGPSVDRNASQIFSDYVERRGGGDPYPPSPQPGATRQPLASSDESEASPHRRRVADNMLGFVSGSSEIRAPDPSGPRT